MDLQKQIKSQTDRLRREEAVQVETLKFETDAGVQVDTLPKHLQRMTSLSAKDAYLMELYAALDECSKHINTLDDMVLAQIPQQGSPELHTTGKKIAKQTASCESSVELINHLCETLINDCSASPEEACADRVKDLSQKYQVLLGQAKTKEHKIRELRYV